MNRQQSYTATWSKEYSDSTTRAIIAQLKLPEDPRHILSVSNNFEVHKRSTTTPYTWSVDSNWTFSYFLNLGHLFIKATPAITVADGTYRLVLKQDAFGAARPSGDVGSDDILISGYTYYAMWSPKYPVRASNGSFSTELVTSEDPGVTFSISDFSIENGTGWTIASTGSGTSSNYHGISATISIAWNCIKSF